jgi:3-dehydroquinate synthetase
MKENDELWETITADASAFAGLTTEGGSELSDLIRQANSVNEEIAANEEQLRALKRKRDHYLHDLIPAKMSEVGMDKVQVDGNTVSLHTFVSARMPQDPMEKQVALQHLRAVGAGDFVKNTVSVSFGLRQDNQAKSFEADLSDRGLDPESKTWVEPMTLKKLIKERVANSQEIDLEIFNAHIGTVAKIKGA